MFVLSKIAGLLLQPLTLALAILALGVVLLFTRWWRGGRMVLALTMIAILGLSVLPVRHWIVGALEDRFPQPEITGAVDGIVILGGFVDPVMTEARGQVALSGAIERLTEALALARAHPQARLVFTGGSGNPSRQDVKEAHALRRLLNEIGLDPERMEFEDQSRNTRENAVLTKDMVQPRPGETWVLVTSASHMPRSVGAFHAVGWPVVAYPVDYSTNGQDVTLGFNPVGGFSALGQGAHEWLGLTYYRLRGWTDELLPGP